MASFAIGVDARQMMSFRGKLRAATLGTPREIRRVNQKYAEILLQSLIRHASGRPGPRVITGRYISNMYVRTGGGGMIIEGGNTSPQAARLELGFVGVDRLGRHYAQPPYPHFTPALLEVAPLWMDELAQVAPRFFK